MVDLEGTEPKDGLGDGAVSRRSPVPGGAHASAASEVRPSWEGASGSDSALWEMVLRPLMVPEGGFLHGRHTFPGRRDRGGAK